MSNRWTAALGLLLSLNNLLNEDLAAAESQRPNILFIFADDLTCQAVSAYGVKRRLLETPNMDRIASARQEILSCHETAHGLPDVVTRRTGPTLSGLAPQHPVFA